MCSNKEAKRLQKKLRLKKTNIGNNAVSRENVDLIELPVPEENFEQKLLFMTSSRLRLKGNEVVEEFLPGKLIPISYLSLNVQEKMIANAKVKRY